MKKSPTYLSDSRPTFAPREIDCGKIHAYRYKGKTLTEMPYGLREWREAKPVYKTVKGWLAPTGGARSFRELPKRAQDYVRFLEDVVACRFKIVSTGAGREETIQVGDPYQR